MNKYKSPLNFHRVDVATPNCTKILQPGSAIQNLQFELESNSGDKEDQANDFLPTFGSSLKYSNKRKYLLTEFNATENANNSKSYSYFNSKPIFTQLDHYSEINGCTSQG